MVGTMTTVEQDFDRLRKRIQNAQSKLDALRKAVRESGTCPHSRVYTHEQDCDNGYGKWWKVPVETCQICGFKRYPRSSNTWNPASAYRDDA